MVLLKNRLRLSNAGNQHDFLRKRKIRGNKISCKITEQSREKYENISTSEKIITGYYYYMIILLAFENAEIKFNSMIANIQIRYFR